MSQRALIAVLVLVVVAGGFEATRYNNVAATLAATQADVIGLKKSVEEFGKASDLSTQEKCHKQAQSEFENLGWNKKPGAFFTNHYNKQMSKCFVQIEYNGMTGNTPNRSVAIFDAFEGKSYANYGWQNRDGKPYWEVAPFICSVYKSGSAETYCKSEEEFNSLAHEYME